jgi:hypothetical protein
LEEDWCKILDLGRAVVLLGFFEGASRFVFVLENEKRKYLFLGVKATFI